MNNLKAVRCKFFEELYSFDTDGKIRNKCNKIMKPSDKRGTHVYLSRRVEGIPYKRLFKIDTLINTDEYLNEKGFAYGRRVNFNIERSTDKFKKIQDGRVRSCSLENINSLNLT